MFKVIIAGGRNFTDYQKLEKACDKILSKITEEIEIVSGAARGSDLLGEQYAKNRGYTIKRFKPDWSIGKKAGILRNIEMGDYADAAIIFWDGQSKGSKHMIDYSKKCSLKVRVVNY